MSAMTERMRPAPLILTPPDSPTAPAKGFRGATPPPSSPSSPSSLEFEAKDSRRMSRLPPLRRPHRAQDDAFVRRHVLGASSPINVDEDEYTAAVPDSYAPKRKGFRLSRLPSDAPASTHTRSDPTVHPSASTAPKHSLSSRPQLPTPSPPAPSPPRTSRLTGPRPPRHSRSSSLSTPSATISALFPSTAPASASSASGIFTASPFPHTPSPLPSTATIPPSAYTRGRTTSLNDVDSTSLPGANASSPPSAFTQGGAYIRKRTISLGNAGLTINTDIKPAGRMLPIPRRSSSTVPAPAPGHTARTNAAPPPSLSRTTSISSAGRHTRSNSSMSTSTRPPSRSSTGMPRPAGARAPSSSRPPSLAPLARPSAEAPYAETAYSASKPAPSPAVSVGRRESYRPLPPAPSRRASAQDSHVANPHGVDSTHVPMHTLDVPMSVTTSPAPSSATYVETPSLAQYVSPSSKRSPADKPTLEASLTRVKQERGSDSEQDSPDEVYDYRALKRNARNSGQHLLRADEPALYGDGGSEDEWEELSGHEKVVKPSRTSTLFALGAHAVPPTTPAQHDILSPTSPDQHVSPARYNQYAAMPETPAHLQEPPASAPINPPSADSMRWASSAQWTGVVSSGSEYSVPSTVLLSPHPPASAPVPLSAPPNAMAFALATNDRLVESPLANAERAFGRALADASDDAPKSVPLALRPGHSDSSTKPATRKPVSPKRAPATPDKSTAFFHTAPSSPKPKASSPTSSAPAPVKKRRAKKTSADASGFSFVRGADGRITRVPVPGGSPAATIASPMPPTSKRPPSVISAAKTLAPAAVVPSVCVSDSASEAHSTPPSTPRLQRLRSKRSFKTPSPAPSLREIRPAPSAFTGIGISEADDAEPSDPAAALQRLNGGASGSGASTEDGEGVIVPPARRESLAYVPSRNNSIAARRESSTTHSRRSSVVGPRAPVRISVGAAQRKRLSKRMSVRRAAPDAGSTAGDSATASGLQTPRAQDVEPSTEEARMERLDVEDSALRSRGARSSASSSAPTLTLSIPPSPSISAPSTTVPTQAAQPVAVPETPSLDDPGALPSPLNTATMPSPGRVAEWTRARYRDSLVPPPGEPPASPNTILRRLREGNAGRSEAPPRPSSPTIALVSSAERPNVTEAAIISHPAREGAGSRGEGQEGQVQRVFTELDRALLLLDVDPELELPEDEPLPAYMLTAAVADGERSLDRGPRRPHGAIRPPPSYASLGIRPPKPQRTGGGGLRALFARNNASRNTVGDESGNESEGGRRRGLRRFFGSGSTGDLRMMEAEPRRSTSSLAPSYMSTTGRELAPPSSLRPNASSINARRPSHAMSLSADMASSEPPRPESSLRAGSLDVRSSSAMELSRTETRQSEQTTHSRMDEDSAEASPFPSSTPSVGRPLLRDGRILVYPEGHECSMCNNTGFAHDDPNHACEICWNKHSRPFTSVLARFFRRGVAKKDRARLQKPLRAPNSAPGNIQSFAVGEQAGPSVTASTHSHASHRHQ
ncbi:unnamed protein product [Peniophora sp. CBMAI 1063]|nr:unnamed protein product [Peniophora sp. CBMAI 1063]